MFVSMEHYDSVREVERAYPGAHFVHPVDGGWMVFDSAVDYLTWQQWERGERKMHPAFWELAQLKSGL